MMGDFPSTDCVVCRSVGGYHFMYADTFLDRQEFSEMFDLTLYETVREKYHAVGQFIGRGGWEVSGLVITML